MIDKIIELFIQIGIGSIIGVIIGMLFQYFISKKLKVFETKLVIFRRVYKQLYYFVLMNQEEIALLNGKPHAGICLANSALSSGLDLKKDLGDILYYVDGKIEKKIGSLIYNLYQENAVFSDSDLDDIIEIMEELKKFVN
jgi:hypothetical protein